MTTAAATARPGRVLAALVRATDAVTRHVVVALAAIVAFQILATIALFVSVDTNGWLTYQGATRSGSSPRRGCSGTGRWGTR
ncbi:MAG: hypothetical protein M5U27_12245 [Gaiella sp.]|nr:hypothetical protein [Gaiella sp.]